MATIEARSSGPNAEEDTFVHDLKEILEAGPNLNESPSNVHSGTSHKMEINAVNQSDIYNSNEHNLRIGVSFPNSQPMPPANTNVPLSIPQRNGETPSKPSLVKSQSKIDNIKQWGISTYKCTRQILSERFGKASKTVDLELEAQIEVLRDTQKKYANILRLARALTSNFYHVVQTQRALGEAFSDLAQKSPELHEEFSYNAETQRVLCKSGETLLSALNFFTSSVNTLCNKTIEDTLTTIKLYETSRIEYDAYRSDLEILSTSPRTDAIITRLRETQDVFQYHKERFDRLRQDVTVKLRFLDENKVKVMHKQLLLFHNAISAYFSGNQSALEATLKQFNIKLKPPNAEGASWLEQ